MKPDPLTFLTEITIEQFVQSLKTDEILALVQEICESSNIPIERIRSIVNSKGFDE
jgi:hypothetical protein